MNSSSFYCIGNLVSLQAEVNPDFDVLTFLHNGERQVRTYSDLWQNGQKLARGLMNIGLKKGDRFALLLQNHPEFVELMVASSIGGFVFVPIDPRTRGVKLRYLLNDSGCKGIVCADYSFSNVREVIEDCNNLEWILNINDRDEKQAAVHVGSIAEIMAAPAVEPALDLAVKNESEVMQIMYTSGTTGDPKGIIIPHTRFCKVAGDGETVFGYQIDDRPYTGLSLTHGNAQFITLAPSLKMGLRAVISRKFTKSKLWSIVRKYDCTTFSLLGGMATAIFAEPEQPDDADNPVSMVISAGMPAVIWEKFEQRFGLKVFEFYGAMEGGMTFKRIGEGPIGSCGKAAPGLIAKVVDENGSEVKPGEPGELLFRLESGPFPPVAYHNNPDASKKKVVDGWLHSGDIVVMNEDGWIFYQFREGGGLRRNGEFINPALVERVLAEHPNVDDVFIYGIPAVNGAPGEKDVVAAITPKDKLDPKELLNWVRERIEANMVPSYLQIVDEIPKTASEKPQERFLLEMFKNKPDQVYLSM